MRNDRPRGRRWAASAARGRDALAHLAELCTKLVRPGGHVANIGVHGRPATLHLEDLWIRNITITTGLVVTDTTPTMLHMLAAGRLDTTRFITHRFALDEMAEAYEVFSSPQRSGALKVSLTRL